MPRMKAMMNRRMDARGSNVAKAMVDRKAAAIAVNKSLRRRYTATESMALDSASQSVSQSTMMGKGP